MGGGNTQSKKGRTESHTGSNYPMGGGGRRGQPRKGNVRPHEGQGSSELYMYMLLSTGVVLHGSVRCL